MMRIGSTRSQAVSLLMVDLHRVDKFGGKLQKHYEITFILERNLLYNILISKPEEISLHGLEVILLQ